MSKFVQKSIFIVTMLLCAGQFAQPALHKRKQRENEDQNITGEKPRKKLKVAKKNGKKRKPKDKHLKTKKQRISLPALEARMIALSILQEDGDVKEQATAASSDEKKQIAPQVLPTITHEVKTSDDKHIDQKSVNNQPLTLDNVSDEKEEAEQSNLTLPTEEEIIDTLSRIALNDDDSSETAISSVEQDADNKLVVNKNQPVKKVFNYNSNSLLAKALSNPYIVNGCIFAVVFMERFFHMQNRFQ